MRAVIRHLKDFLEHRVVRGLDRALDRAALEQTLGRSLAGGAERVAFWQSAEYVADHLYRATPVRDRRALFELALAAAPTSGPVLEFGVAAGESLRLLAGLLPDGPLIGFDSFAGLPERWRHGFEAGAFRADPATLDLPPGVRLVVGLFADTLPGHLAESGQAPRLIHIDCDLYRSTVDVLDLLGDRLGAGSVLVFDEYFNHPGWRQGEFKAWQEFIATRRLRYEYLAYREDHQQVAVRIVGPME